MWMKEKTHLSSFHQVNSLDSHLTLLIHPLLSFDLTHSLTLQHSFRICMEYAWILYLSRILHNGWEAY